MDTTIAEELIKVFEGFKSRPYKCPAGIPTIGYGSTYYLDGTPVKLTDNAITEQEALQLLRATILKEYLPGVLRLCPILITDNKKLNAILDFTYNLGVGRLQISTLRKRINASDWEGAKSELSKWDKAGGKVLKGLTKRRKAEILLFN
jgi:lysozyme